MKFKVNKIAAAVAVSLGTSVVGMNAARADAILFPYVALSPTVTTILSVINDDNDALDELHYRYYRNGGSGPCTEFDFWNDTSENDIVTFDMGAVFGADDPQGVLFEPERTNAVYTDDFAILGRQGGVNRGYVLVDNAPFNPTDPLPAPTAQLAGEAIVIEFNSGSAWGYRAYNASEIWALTPPTPAAPSGRLLLQNQYDFSDRAEQNGEVLVAAPGGTPGRVQKTNFWVPVSILPWDVVTTRFFVTPISTTGPFFQGPPGSSATTATIAFRGTAEGSDRVMFNRDERAFSGARSANVTCVGAVSAADLVDNLVLQSTPQGGWSNLVVTQGQAIVFKAEYNEDRQSELNGVPVDGSFNNVVWLRKGLRESLGRPFIQAGWGFLPTYDIPGIDNNSPYAVLRTDTGLTLPPPSAGGVAYYDADNFAAPSNVAAAIARGDVFISTGQ
jgi:hypothetical protein